MRAEHGPTGKPEVFRATEDDGTAEVVQAGKPVDQGAPETDLSAYAPKKKAPVAPVVKKTTVTVESEDSAPEAEPANLASLKRENAALKSRLETLEQAKTETKKAAGHEAPAAGDGSATETDVAKAEAASEAANTAPGADVEAPKEPTNGEVVESDPAIPTDTVEGRMKEKTRISREARTELAKEARTEAKKKDLRDLSTRFDVVPDKHIAELAQRLKYANDILKRWGRAYDYRVTTLKDFQKIVAELEAGDEKTSKAN